MEFQISNNENRLRFETKVSEEYGYIDYRWHNGSLFLMHTFVPEAGRGKGYSAALAKYAFEYARDKKVKVVIYCPYVAKYLKEHPEFEIIIDKSSHR